ncbi:MAG TPA: toxin, partial [Limnochordia bacterium]
IKFNYWDGGRRGLLAGEALQLDVRRMEMAYHEHNAREYELTKHVSLRQLDPVALLTLKVTGRCEVSLPEWVFDLDCPGHYMRRIKRVSLSIPAVAGPYTSVNCTLSLIKSTLRRSPQLRDGEYARAEDGEDDRFIDYYGTIQSIVTSHGQDDGGMFDTNLPDERFLPFEGAGAISTWRLELPAAFRQFDYDTISDVILHVRYTARDGGEPLREASLEALEALVEDANASGLMRLFSLRHDFPTEWHRFVTGEDDLRLVIEKDHFPYFASRKDLTIERIELHAIDGDRLVAGIPGGVAVSDLTDALAATDRFALSLAPDGNVLQRAPQAQVFLAVRYAVRP